MAGQIPTDATSPTGTGPGGHDWHSPRYVQQWIAEKEAQTAERQKQFDLLADCIPYPREADIHILDIGAGWGPLTLHLLDRFPSARATLLDYSEAMLAEARDRLTPYGARVQYRVSDLSQQGALITTVATAGAPFDAIVSCCCFHNIDPAERIALLYREIRGAVAAGGCFLNLDSVGTDEPILRQVSHHMRVEQLRSRRLAETGTLPSYVEVATKLDIQRQGRHEGSHGTAPERRALMDHLTWLQQANFDAVECFWRQENSALIGGYVAARTERAS